MATDKPSRRSHKLRCGVTATFLVIFVIVIITLFFTIFKPKDPKISLYPEGIKDIDFSALTPNVTLSLGTVVAIENPNYGSTTKKRF